jgi:hypothetical protein
MVPTRPFWFPATVLLAAIFLVQGSVAHSQTSDVGATSNTAGPGSNLASGLMQCGLTYWPAGWYIVGAPAGTVIAGATGSLYTFQAGDSAYETVPANAGVKPGYGYWAYFPSDMSQNFPTTRTGADMVQITLLANQPILIGDPFSTPASVSGVDQLTIYQPQTGTYVTTFGLGQGQGAWAFSAKGGQVTLRSICPVPP